MDRQVLLANTTGLVGADLTPAYNAIRSNQSPAGVYARFKKKEDINSMAKSILKHKIQTLTGKNMKIIEDEMKYKPKDPNEPSMDIDTLRRLASCLILLSNDELPNYANVDSEQEDVLPQKENVKAGSKRSSSSQMAEETDVRKPRAGRRSIAVIPSETGINTLVSKSKSRRSIAVVPISEEVEASLPQRSSKSSTNASAQEKKMVSQTPATLPRISRRSVGRVKNINNSVSGNISTTSSVSQSVTNCLGPTESLSENLALVEEAENDEVFDSSMANPTPLMKEMLNKRKSVLTKPSNKSIKSPEKAKPQCLIKPPPSPPPRSDFVGYNDSHAYLLAGDPMDLKLTKIISTLPLSANFKGAHLTVVHTPADWTPTEVFQVSKQIKQLNKEIGLSSFVILVGTGLHNVHMNMEALYKHTKHVQFVTFHREDANTSVETGKLRETTSFFLAAYFFSGCEKEGSSLPTKMVRDGYTTCFRTDGTTHLEKSIIDCFSESGEWLLDLCCGRRQLSVSAVEKGRSAIALHNDSVALEELGNYLRTIALQSDESYRDKDGIVLNVINQ